MPDQNLFPLGVATGNAFCNRQKERQFLAQSIKKGRHTLIVAQRRYGKTSLVAQVVEDIRQQRAKFVHVSLDFSLTPHEITAEHQVARAVGSALGAMLPATKAALRSLSSRLLEMNPKFAIHIAGQSVELSPDKQPPAAINELLRGLDETAARRKYRVLLFVDEFQEIGKLPDAAAIEAAFRNAAQYAQAVTYVFSGSTRHLLKRMFDDPERPFYRLCDQLVLERIAHDEYRRFLADAAKLAWRKALPPEVIDDILQLTQCHAYYINLLCDRIWRSKALPSQATVTECWNACFHIEKRMWTDKLNKLSRNKMALVYQLALTPTAHPTSDEFLRQAGINKSTAWKSLNELVAEDIIAEQDGLYRVVNPMLDWLIQQKT